jgi:hypothetical protein
MLGEKVGAFTGKTIGQRVLPSADGPRVETTNELTGELGGVPATWLATYNSTVRADGSLYGECPDQGLIMTPDGIGTWKGAGVGCFTDDAGSASFRGAVYLVNVPAKLAELAKVALMFEYEQARDGSATLHFWEWK